MKFEDKLDELNKIVSKLESPQTSLGEGIKLFEKSLELTKSCLAELNESKEQVELIKKEFDDIIKEI